MDACLTTTRPPGKFFMLYIVKGETRLGREDNKLLIAKCLSAGSKVSRGGRSDAAAYLCLHL
jgi:hypothetical protein